MKFAVCPSTHTRSARSRGFEKYTAPSALAVLSPREISCSIQVQKGELAHIDNRTSTALAMSFGMVDGGRDEVGKYRGDPDRPSGRWWSRSGVDMLRHPFTSERLIGNCSSCTVSYSRSGWIVDPSLHHCVSTHVLTVLPLLRIHITRVSYVRHHTVRPDSQWRRSDTQTMPGRNDRPPHPAKGRRVAFPSRCFK